MAGQFTIASRVAAGSAFAYFLFKAISVHCKQSTLKQAPAAATLTPKQIEVIKATIPVLEEHGNTITTVFYRNMLNEHPELNEIFNTANQANGHQARALAGALFAYASHIDDLAALGPAVEVICNKHASLYIQPDDYEIVGQYLLAAMEQVLGSAFTEDIHDAWETAYWALANVLINREATLYKESVDWSIWRSFKVTSKVAESSEIMSIYLKPADNKPLPAFRPGQYISVKVDVPRLGYSQPRQYSLSDRPQSDYYRISIKKELGVGTSPGSETNPGYVSNVLHDNTKEGDVVQVSHPRGDFFLSSETATHPIVLLSAGVGVSPLISIFNTVFASSSRRNVHFIHGSRTTKARAFKDHVQPLAKTCPNIQVTLFTVQPSDEDKEGVTYDYAGRVSLKKLDSNTDLYLDNRKTEYYVCGPESFMTDMAAALRTHSVSPDRIKLELFGTGGLPQW